MGLFDFFKSSAKQKEEKKEPRKKIAKRMVSKPGKVKKKPQKPQEKEIGRITHYFRKISVGIIKLKAELKIGDKIHIKGAHDDFNQVVKSMQYNHKDISSAKGGLEVGIKVTKRVHENDKVYK